MSHALSRRCVICNQEQANFLFHPPSSPGPIVRCAQCGLVYVGRVENGRSLIEAGPVLGDFDATLLTSADLCDVADCWELLLLPAKEAEWPASRLNALDALNRIKRHIQPPGKLLDFGCGWGFFLGIAKEHGWEPYGLEPLPGHAVYARARFGATVVTDTLRDDTFPAAFFDVITAFQVFEHLPDPAGDLARLYRMLKPGGLILIEVPNIATWSVRLLGPRHRHFVRDHLTFFSGHTLRLLLEKQGFEMLGVYHPTRRMTVRHLVGDWGGRYLPKRIPQTIEMLIKRMGLWEKIIAINLGDIVAAIARKPE